MDVIIGHIEDDHANACRMFLMQRCMGIPMPNGTVNVDPDMLLEAIYAGIIDLPKTRANDPVPTVYLINK